MPEAEFKDLLADLSNEPADAKSEAASLKECIATLQEEICVQLRRGKMLATHKRRRICPHAT